MDQVDTLDFKALMAKFQEDEHLLKPPPAPKIRPAVPERPRTVPPPPPPQSPTHYLPAGARPSLLSSISLEGRSAVAPRVIFKDAKKPLVQVNAKVEGKPKRGKDKTKGGKEKPDGAAGELVPGAPPPQATLSKRKGFLGFRKAAKRNSWEVPSAEPILDSPSSNGLGPAPLIPAPQIPAPQISAPQILAPQISAPQILAPQILAPQIPAPQIPVPQISAPQISAPQILAPQIPAPQISAPQISAPQILAPQILAPQILAPQILAPQIPAPLIPALLIPPPSDFGDSSAVPEPASPRGLLSNIPTLPDSRATVEAILASPDFTPPPAFVPDAPGTPTPESEALEVETPSLLASWSASRNETAAPDPTGAASTPRPGPAASTPSPTPPELHELAAEEEEEEEEEEEASVEAVHIAEVEAPPPPPPLRRPPPPPPAATDPASSPPSPKAERSVSALAALSRVEVKRSALDQRIFNALEKARRKISPPTNPSTTYSLTPPPEESPPSLTDSLPDLPTDDNAGNARPSKPVNGFDHRQASPVLVGVAEEGSGAVPELLVVPPPHPTKRALPDPQSLGPTPEKPIRRLSGAAPLEFSEDLPEFESRWGDGEQAGPDASDGQNRPELYSNGSAPPASGDRDHREPEPSQGSPGLEGGNGVDSGVYEITEDAYEAVPAKKKGKGDSGGKRRKGTLKNPYAEAQQEAVKSVINEEKIKTGRFGKNDRKAEGPDEKELRKREKQRLEKEKKELKEKQEREKKEQKEKQEREKKENEMKKKFQITGQEDAIYQATVTVTNKGRKGDLPVNSGDVVSIIRTTNCPKGKWLARDGSNNCGYIAVDHVELDIKEMLELGKKAASGRVGGGNNNNNNVEEEEEGRTGSRASNHDPASAESFSDDSEEWTGDDEEPLSPAPEPEYPLASTGHTRALSMPDMGDKELSVNHSHSRSDVITDGPDVQARQEALHKLATFFHSPKPKTPPDSRTEPETSPVLVKEEEVPLAPSTQEVDFNLAELIILPPPDLYADFTGE